MLYQVIDNFLPDEDFEDLVKNTVDDEQFPWLMGRGKVPRQIEDNEIRDQVKKVDFQFVHTFFNETQWCSDKGIVLLPVLNKLEPMALIRIKMNLTMPYDKVISYGLHTDVHPEVHKDRDFMTAVYYLNDNDGGTVFEDGSKVDSVANRIVMFHGSTKHAATTFTNAPYRAVLNLNWV